MLNTLFGVNDGFNVNERRGCDYFYWDIEWLTDPGRKELGSIDDSNLVYDGYVGCECEGFYGLPILYYISLRL